MKKFFKCTICTMLAFVMVLSTTTVAFAKNDITPVIAIHGIGGTALYKDIGTENEKAVPEFSAASFFTIYNNLLKKVLAAANGEKINSGKLIDEMADMMNDFTDIACDKNGNSKENVTIKDYWTDSVANHQDYLNSRTTAEPAIEKQISDKIGAKNVYVFRYDWRLDACENAKKLNSFIDEIKEKTGKSKVTLVSCSEGTLIASAYIDRYMSKNDIEKTIFVNGAFQGVGVCKLFSKDINIDKDIVLNYFRNLLNDFNNPDFDLKKLAFLSITLEDAVDNLCSLLNEIADSPKLLNRLYNEVFYPVFGCIPIYWEFIPYDTFNTAVKEMSKIGFLDKKSGLYSKLSKYHKVQGRLEDNLNKLKAKGVEVAIIANYGTVSIPVTSTHKDQSDILIETKYASVGATVADYGKNLSKSGKYVSPDKIIDASTCTLPDNTWFFKDVQHVQFVYGSEACDLLATMVTTDAKLNIKSIEKETGVGQFIGTDSNQNIINVTNNNSTANHLNLTTVAEDKKKSPLTGSSNLLIAGTTAFTLTLLAMLSVIVLKKKSNKYC